MNFLAPKKQCAVVNYDIGNSSELIYEFAACRIPQQGRQVLILQLVNIEQGRNHGIFLIGETKPSLCLSLSNSPYLPYLEKFNAKLVMTCVSN